MTESMIVACIVVAGIIVAVLAWKEPRWLMLVVGLLVVIGGPIYASIVTGQPWFLVWFAPVAILAVIG